MNLNSLKEKFKKFFRIRETKFRYGFDILNGLTYEENCARDLVWYSGRRDQIEQVEALIGENSFWGTVNNGRNRFMKKHFGLPKLIVDTLVNISVNDFSGIAFEKDEDAKLWAEITSKNDIKKILKKVVKYTEITGDCAVKIGFNDKVSEHPLMSVYYGENVYYNYLDNNIIEIIFLNKYNIKDTEYTLVETYGYGYIKYSLFQGDSEVPLSRVDFLANLQDVYFDDKLMLAIPFMITESDTYKGRGTSILDAKLDMFDALDLVISQLNDCILKSGAQVFIPEDLFPTNPETGDELLPSPFDLEMKKLGAVTAEGATQGVVVYQPDIKTEALTNAYILYLDGALQGIISPSTIGIDTKKLDNAEAQREKEKTTLYTRQTIVEALTPFLTKLINTLFAAETMQYGGVQEDREFSFSFGEYANPSFEALIETMSKAAPNKQTISFEKMVDEIWGYSLTKEQKAEEVARLKELNVVNALYGDKVSDITPEDNSTEADKEVDDAKLSENSENSENNI